MKSTTYPADSTFALYLGVLALLLLTCCRGCSAELPDFRYLPHYMHANQCEPFSREARAMLNARGIPAREIFYRWSLPTGEGGYHAAVLFQFEGKFFFMDNWRQGARPVAAKTDLGCVNRISPGEAFVSMVDEHTMKRIAPRKMLDLFAAPPEWMKGIQTGTVDNHR